LLGEVLSAARAVSGLESFGPQPRVVVVGASGGLGAALADAAEAAGALVTRVSRRDSPTAALDDAGFGALAAAHDGLAAVIVATGALHRDGRGPERDWRMLDADWMAEQFAVNAILPALAAKHFLPRLRRDSKAVFAALSARVGSIADNRLGGWHSYRASKAALNQIVKTLAVELARKNPAALALALHPGTVDTGMSRPFARNVPAERLQGTAEAAARLWAVMEACGPADSGRFLDHRGETVPW
jgi:NAD(P)-dependent dehydrogenase (short-subunit alcohol dehydrogenase family)